MSSSIPILSYTDGFNRELRPLLDQYDRIRHHLENDQDLHATSIVVIGDQSSGKSSVLESLVQIGLPRGENIVTRMPIILQCRSLKTDTDEKPHAKVSISSPDDDRNYEITDFEEIEATIQKCQDIVIESSNVTGTGGSSISDIPIYVQIVKEGIPDVTLIDLPGLNYANETIRGKIGSLYKYYIEKENVIILNVISAVTDPEASESVLLSKNVDPQQRRTIFVLTKIDRCANAEIAEKVKQMRSSGSRFVLVRNRTPDEIRAKLTWEQVRSKEDQSLFKLSGVETSEKGIPALSSLLVKEGHRMIRQSVEQLSNRLPTLLKTLKSQLVALGEPIETDLEKKGYFDEISHELGPHLRELLNGFSRIGDSKDILLNLHIQQFLDTYGSRFATAESQIFSANFRKSIQDSIKNTSGLTLSNFLSSPVMQAALKKLITDSGIYRATTKDLLMKKRAEPLDFCGVVDYIIHVVNVLLQQRFRKIPIHEDFQKMFQSDLEKHITNLGEKASVHLAVLINAEVESGPYTTDSSYTEEITKVDELLNKAIKEYGSKKDRFISLDDKIAMTIGKRNLYFSDLKDVLENHSQIQKTKAFMIQASLYIYWTILEKRLKDQVHLLVRHCVCDKLRKWEELMGQLWSKNSEEYLKVIVEDEKVVEERERLRERIYHLEEAYKVLNIIHMG